MPASGASSGRWPDAIVVGAMPIADEVQLRLACAEAHLVVAADGGTNSLVSAGIAPTLVVGDLDSVTDGALSWCAKRGVPVRRYPREKDETDLQLACAECVTQGHRRIAVFGASGGRLDHTLGNLGLMCALAREGIECRLVDGRVEAFIILGTALVDAACGDTLSLLPLDDVVSGVTTTGLRYPLSASTLSRGGVPSGVSNVVTSSGASVTVEHGMLLLVHTRGLVSAHGPEESLC